MTNRLNTKGRKSVAKMIAVMDRLGKLFEKSMLKYINETKIIDLTFCNIGTCIEHENKS